MAFKGPVENKSVLADLVRPGKRLYLNRAKDKLVSPDDPEAAFLYCTENDEVPKAEYERLISGSHVAAEESAGVSVQHETKRRRGRPPKVK